MVIQFPLYWLFYYPPCSTLLRLSFLYFSCNVITLFKSRNVALVMGQTFNPDPHNCRWIQDFFRSWCLLSLITRVSGFWSVSSVWVSGWRLSTDLESKITWLHQWAEIGLLWEFRFLMMDVLTMSERAREPRLPLLLSTKTDSRRDQGRNQPPFRPLRDEMSGIERKRLEN